MRVAAFPVLSFQNTSVEVSIDSNTQTFDSFTLLSGNHRSFHRFRSDDALNSSAGAQRLQQRREWLESNASSTSDDSERDAHWRAS